MADVIGWHGADYLKRHGAAVPSGHVRAMRAITRCRTGALGGHVARCNDCGGEHLRFHSCRHRACPQCGRDATERWLARQQDLLLPVPYFHVVFTLPAELRRVVRSHQRELIGALFKAAFDSLSALCADPKWLGGRVGALAVLHTWSRTLEWHPHLHLLVPGGALAPDGQTWLEAPKYRKRFLVPVKALAKHFRGRFLHLARRALPNLRLPHVPWGKRWVAFSKPVATHPDVVLSYLGRYVHRTALSDKAITACNATSVTFAYRDSRDHQRKTVTLSGHDFLRRFLQHVPLKGLHRVRSFGLLHPSQRPTLRRLQLTLSKPHAAEPPSAGPRNSSDRQCPFCNSTRLARRRHLTAQECLASKLPLANHPLPRAPPCSPTTTVAA